MEKKHLELLLGLAKQAIKLYVIEGIRLPTPENYPKEFYEKKGVFVTIEERTNNKYELRGCIGFPYAVKPLAEAVIDAAMEATQDPRFPDLQKSELGKIKVEVSVLSDAIEIKEKTPEGKLKAIKQETDGIILKAGPYSSLFLPQVWEDLPKKESFLEHLSMKAMLPKNAWKDPEARLYKFTVEKIEEKF